MDEVADVLGVGGTGPVLWHLHVIWLDVIPEHLRTVVQPTMEDAQVIILMEDTSKCGSLSLFPFHKKTSFKICNVSSTEPMMRFKNMMS